MKHALLLCSLLVVAAVASGCASSAKDQTTSEVPTDIQTVHVTQDTGAIRGVVVTSSITPIQDAVVKLNGVNQTTKTSGSGSFSFTGLKAGTYFLVASKLGFATVQQSTTVTAGDENPPVLKIQLTQDLATTPFTEMLSWKGFLNCGASVSSPVVYAGGNYCQQTPVTQGDDTNHVFTFGSGIPTFTQSELVWQGSQPTGNALSLTYYTSGVSDWKSSHGPSPVILNATHDELVSKNPGGANATGFTNRVFAESSFDTIGPQVVVNQDFNVYVTHFYHFTPRGGWTFIADGPCDKPEQCT